MASVFIEDAAIGKRCLLCNFIILAQIPQSGTLHVLGLQATFNFYLKFLPKLIFRVFLMKM
jgi:hypothetical protein